MSDITDATMGLIGLGVGLAIVNEVVNHDDDHEHHKHKKRKEEKPFKW